MYSKFHSPNSSINKTILIFQFLIFLSNIPSWYPSSITSFYKEFFVLFFIHTNSTCSKFHFHVNLKKNPKIFLNISLAIPHTAYRFPIPCQAFQHNFEKRKEGEKDKIKLLAEREILEFAPNDRLSSKDPSLREGSETIFPIRTIGVNDRRGGSGEANRFLFPCSLPHPPSCAREGEGREEGGEGKAFGFLVTIPACHCRVSSSLCAYCRPRLAQEPISEIGRRNRYTLGDLSSTRPGMEVFLLGSRLPFSTNTLFREC